jgi:hypothetical protein
VYLRTAAASRDGFISAQPGLQFPLLPSGAGPPPTTTTSASFTTLISRAGSETIVILVFPDFKIRVS